MLSIGTVVLNHLQDVLWKWTNGWKKRKIFKLWDHSLSIVTKKTKKKHLNLTNGLSHVFEIKTTANQNSILNYFTILQRYTLPVEMIVNC